MSIHKTSTFIVVMVAAIAIGAVIGILIARHEHDQCLREGTCHGAVSK